MRKESCTSHCSIYPWIQGATGYVYYWIGKKIQVKSIRWTRNEIVYDNMTNMFDKIKEYLRRRHAWSYNVYIV